MKSEKSPGKVQEEDIFKDFCSRRGLAPSSIRLYTIALQKYVNFTGLTLKNLLEEAEAEEDQNIRFRKRKISNYLVDFKKYLEESDYSKNYRSQIFISVTAFYNEYDIELPRPKHRKSRKDKKPETIDDIPNMDEIQKAIEDCNPLYKAIATLGLSSGMGRAEITSLTFKNFYDALSLDPYPETIPEIIRTVKEKGDLIPLWSIERIKTGNPYFTFSSPENVDKIVDYLDFLHTKHPNYKPNSQDKLFRNINLNQSLEPQSISAYFRTVNKRCGFRIVGNSILVRPHSLRKYFATTLEKNKMPHLATRWLMGHSIDSTTSAYFKADPEAVKQDYIEVMGQLMTNRVKTIVIDKYEEVSQELEDVKSELAYLKKTIDPIELNDLRKPRYRF